MGLEHMATGRKKVAKKSEKGAKSPVYNWVINSKLQASSSSPLLTLFLYAWGWAGEEGVKRSGVGNPVATKF